MRGDGAAGCAAVLVAGDDVTGDRPGRSVSVDGEHLPGLGVAADAVPACLQPGEEARTVAVDGTVPGERRGSVQPRHPQVRVCIGLSAVGLVGEESEHRNGDLDACSDAREIDVAGLVRGRAVQEEVGCEVGADLRERPHLGQAVGFRIGFGGGSMPRRAFGVLDREGLLREAVVDRVSEGGTHDHPVLGDAVVESRDRSAAVREGVGVPCGLVDAGVLVREDFREVPGAADRLARGDLEDLLGVGDA